MRSILAAILLLVAVPAALAQDAAQNVAWANRTGVATAMARALFEARGEAQAAAEVGAIPVDLDFTQTGLLLTLRNHAGCTGFGCGIQLFRLEGDTYREILGDAGNVRATPPNEIGLVNQMRGGFLDLRFGQDHLSWNGRSYADVSTFPVTTPETGRFTASCVQQDVDNYALEQAGVEKATGRKTICECVGARMGSLGLQQADVDRYAEYVAATLDDDYENDYVLEEALGPLKGEMDSARRGCIVQSGWGNWSFSFGTADPQDPQQPLSFAAFLPACLADGWVVGDSKIGTPDRAIALCGCLGRKVAASGASQAALDGVGSFYGGAIAEDDLAAIDPGLLELSDSLSSQCVRELPERPRP